MLTWAAFTLGHDYDTVESIRETSDFAMHHKFAFAAYNILMPYPGTPLYNRLEAESRLLYGGKWWLHPEYRFNDAAGALYRFVWHEFCDWYLEAIKPTVARSPAQEQVLRTVLNAVLRMLHPICPVEHACNDPLPRFFKCVKEHLFPFFVMIIGLLQESLFINDALI